MTHRVQRALRIVPSENQLHTARSSGRNASGYSDASSVIPCSWVSAFLVLPPSLPPSPPSPCRQVIRYRLTALDGVPAEIVSANDTLVYGSRSFFYMQVR